jgi:hypothetical protein
MSNKDQTNKFNLKSFLQSKKGRYSLISALVLGVLLISGLFTSNLLKQNEIAQAALNCPSGSTVNGAGTGCVSTTPSAYTCPGGQFLGGNGAQCFVTGQTGTSYSCPSGGTVSGASCVATAGTPVTADPLSACPPGSGVFAVGNQPAQLINPQGFRECLLQTGSGSTFVINLGSCGNGLPSYYGDISPLGYAYCGWSTGSCGQQGCRYYVLPGILYGNYSYAATGTPIFGPVFTQNATPVFGTSVTPTSYTPNNGQITNLTCTPPNPAAGTTVNCSGQGTGAPSGVPYAGSVTVSIDNGGGSIATTFNPDGTFTASLVTVGSTTGAKTATTNLGGTTPVNVVAGSTIVDPDLASGNGSVGNSTDCTSTTNVSIGTTYTCTFPINGTGPFVLPSGGIQARTNQTTNNSTPVSSCTISASVLTCTAITTIGTPNPLTSGNGNVQLGKGTTPATWNNKGVINLTTASTLCSAQNPCALFDTALTYSPTQALAKRYGGSGSSTADNLILTLKDTRLETSGYTTTCTFRYKFKSDTTWRSLSSSVAYNNTTGCTSTLLTANQLFWNVDFEITAVTSDNTTTKNYLLYSNYDFKAGSIGVTSIGGSGL